MRAFWRVRWPSPIRQLSLILWGKQAGQHQLTIIAHTQHPDFLLPPITLASHHTGPFAQLFHRPPPILAASANHRVASVRVPKAQTGVVYVFKLPAVIEREKRCGGIRGQRGGDEGG